MVYNSYEEGAGVALWISFSVYYLTVRRISLYCDVLIEQIAMYHEFKNLASRVSSSSDGSK